MSKGNISIRLRYSSLINYVALIYRSLIAIGFAVIVARRLSIDEFGLWGIILSTSTMLCSLVHLWSFWVQRYVARGVWKAFSYGFVLSLVYLAIGGSVYVCIALLEDLVLGWGFRYMLYGLPIFVLFVLDYYVDKLLAISKPEVIGYRRFIYETLRLCLAYVFVVMLGLKLIGVILCVAIALLVSVVYGLTVLFRFFKFTWEIDKSLIFKWFSTFYVPLLDVLWNFIYSGLRVFVSWVTGSGVPVAYLNVGLASLTPLAKSADAAIPALYARVLRNRKGSDVTEVLRIFFLLNGFMYISMIALSKSIASMYNPLYTDAYVVVILISTFALINGLTNIYITVIRGVCDVDKNETMSHKMVVKSPLFWAPLARLLSLAGSYSIGLGLVWFWHGDHLFEALGVALGLVTGSVVLLPWAYHIAKKMIVFRIPWHELTVALLGGGLVGCYYLTSGATSIIIHRFWTDTPLLGMHVLVAGLVYFTVWYLLSSWFRGLIKSSIRLVYRG